MSQFLKILGKRNRFLVGVVITLLVVVGVTVASCDSELPKSSEPPEAQWNITCEDELLEKLETSDKEFKSGEIGKYIVYWHQRMIDEAIVELDYIRYLFDRDTGEFMEKEVHWRDDLPEHLPPIISREEAESLVKRKVDSSSLYYISPDSSVFPIELTPMNPCWAVRILDDKGYNIDVIVIDAVEGKIVGHGVPVP